ncbi:hsp90-like protein [Phlyctema vagabunda]|uniref:Hsp90-like protein n=1 Tax=Phlyctema vagabunda TaxID=108571 RepID=A0ABR4PPG5_9HELO
MSELTPDIAIGDLQDRLNNSLRVICEESPHPCAILDLDQDLHFGTHISHYNDAFKKTIILADLANGNVLDKPHTTLNPQLQEYLSWLRSGHEQEFVCTYAGFFWSSVTTGERWRLIHGKQSQPPRGSLDTQDLEPKDVNPCRNKLNLIASKDTQKSSVLSPVFDWTRTNPPENLSQHAHFIRSIDWSDTSIGPMDDWSPLLRSWCNLVLTQGMPAGIFWGPDSLMIYNEAFVEFAGAKHPDLMGQHPRTQFAEVWDHFEGILEHCRQTGKEVKEDDTCLFLKRRGFLEECYVSFAFIPIVGDGGYVVGNYHMVHETTQTIIAARRMNTLITIGNSTAAAQTLQQFWNQLYRALEDDNNDIPCAMLFSVSQPGTSRIYVTNPEDFNDGGGCLLEWTIGCEKRIEAMSSQFDYEQNKRGLAPAFRQAIETNGPINIPVGGNTFHDYSLNNSQQRAFGDVVKSCIVCPLRPTKHESVIGFLVLGQNTRQSYSKDYQTFIDMLCRQLGTSLASTVLNEEEVRRGRSAATQAALDRAELAETVKLRTEEIKAKEERFASLTEHAPVGVFIQSVSGDVLYRNKRLLELSVDSQTDLESSNQSILHPSCGIDTMSDSWKQLHTGKVIVVFETKLDAPWTPPVQISNIDGRENIWTLTSAYPELSPTGEVVNIIGFVTDISQQKWTEKVQKQEVIIALEAKRQQENFIDMTSHEIRNPLSAIMQCADGIINWLSDESVKLQDSVGTSIESSIEAASTIMSCCQHQKNIVDDILTLSKLDSGLLQMAPVRSDIVEVIQNGLRMFDLETSTSKITVDLQIEPSIENLNAHDLEFDQNRVSQVFVNLLSNAIKFTRHEKTRKIHVKVDATIERPGNEDRDVHYFPLKREIVSRDNGNGSLFLTVSVSDTGCGLNEKEQGILFQRFSQASVRTHSKYGGSGLGLFICRELVDLQGGQIGVTSQENVGSTFKFFVVANHPDPQVLRNSLREAADALPSTGVIVVKDLPIRSMYNVLVVEDNVVNQQVLSKQLRRQKCMVNVANHGQEAISYIKLSKSWKSGPTNGFPVSVILMDIEMPVMDGLSCMKEIRRLENIGEIDQHIPILATTANARKEQINQALDAGADDVITKPFRITDLMARIDEIVSRFE